MRKLSVLAFVSFLALPLVLAGGMHGYYGKSAGVVFFQLLAFLLGVFITSIIFWWTYLWMVEDKGQLRRKKK